MEKINQLPDVTMFIDAIFASEVKHEWIASFIEAQIAIPQIVIVTREEKDWMSFDKRISDYCWVFKTKKTYHQALNDAFEQYTSKVMIWMYDFKDVTKSMTMKIRYYCLEYPDYLHNLDDNIFGVNKIALFLDDQPFFSNGTKTKEDFIIDRVLNTDLRNIQELVMYRIKNQIQVGTDILFGNNR